MKFDGEDILHIKIIPVVFYSSDHTVYPAPIAASVNPFNPGSVKPSPTRRKNGSTYKAQKQTRRKDYKRGADRDNGRRRRSKDCEDSRRKRKEKQMATRRSRRFKDENVEDKKEVSRNKEKMVAFYKKYNPTKMDEIDCLLKKYSGHETELFKRLVKKYKAEPSVFGLDEADSAHELKTSHAQSSSSMSAFIFGVCSNTTTFGSSQPIEGFDSVKSTDAKWGSSSQRCSSFTAPFAFSSLSLTSTSTFGSAAGTQFSSLGQAQSISFSPKEMSAFGSMSETKSFGSIATESVCLPNGCVNGGLIRSKSSFDSEMDLN